MATYNFAPVPAWGSVGEFARIGAKRSSTFPVTLPGGGSATVVQGGVTKVGYLESDSNGLIPAFTTTDIPSVVVNFGIGLVTIHSLEAISAGAASAASAAASATSAATSATNAADSAADAAAALSGRERKFQVNVADYATPQLAMAALTDGAHILFPANTYALTGGAKLQPPAGVDNVTVHAGGATFTQNTWGVPVFDLLDVNGWTLDIGLVQYVGTRGDHTGTYRGGALYTHGCAVYSNGDRHHVRNLRTIGMPTPVYFSSWNGASISGHTGVGNHVGKLECEGYDFGVLWTAQRDLVIDDLYAHDDTDDSGGANPTHAYYGSGVSTARSTGVTIKKARCETNVGGQAFQLKYADQVNLTNHSADGCKGLINVLDCDDLTWDGMTGTALTSNTGGAVTFGFSTAMPKRLKATNTTVKLASSNDARAVSIMSDDCVITNLVVEANHSGSVNTAENEVILRGAKGRMRGLTIRSRGTGHMLGATLGYGSDTVSGWSVEDVVVEATRSACDVLGGGSGNIIRYDPTSVSLTGSNPAVSITGTATGAEVSLRTPVQVSLSPLGEHAGLHALAAATPTVPVANNGIQCLVTPRRDIVVSNLVWFSVTASGNYDVAIIDDSTSARLWSKGSTAWPAAGTITETVTGVTMRAGRPYRLVFAADNTTGTYRGVQASAGDMLTRMDGRFAAYLTSAMFPIPATPATGSTASTRVPLLIVKGT